MPNSELLTTFQSQISYQFNDSSLLDTAFTHRSYSHYKKQEVSHNERMEYYGDAVLKFVVSDWLYYEYPEKSEGELTQLRAQLISDNTLAMVGDDLGLIDYLKLAPSEQKQVKRRSSVTANAVEAIIAALHIDGGMDASRDFIIRFVITPHIQHAQQYGKDYRSQLQEFCHAQKIPAPRFEVSGTDGPEHDLNFTLKVDVEFQNKTYSFIGSGPSKKAAAQAASKAALDELEPLSAK